MHSSCEGTERLERVANLRFARGRQTQSLGGKHGTLLLRLVVGAIGREVLSSVQLPVLRTKVVDAKRAQDLDEVAGDGRCRPINAMECQPQRTHPRQRMVRGHLYDDATRRGAVQCPQEREDVRNVEYHVMSHSNVMLRHPRCHVRPSADDEGVVDSELASTLRERLKHL